MKKCPYCAEQIQDAAIICRYCGRDLPKSTNENQPTAQDYLKSFSAYYAQTSQSDKSPGGIEKTVFYINQITELLEMYKTAFSQVALLHRSALADSKLIRDNTWITAI